MNKVLTLLLSACLGVTQLSAQCNPDTEPPAVEAVNGLSVNIMPTGMITLWASDFLKTMQDNCTPTNEIQLAIRKAGKGAGFPLNPDGSPQTSVTFICCEFGTQYLELWARDAAGNANFDSAYVIIQDNMGLCGPCNPTIEVCAKNIAKQYIETVHWELTAQHPALPPFGMYEEGACSEFNGVPYFSNATIIPTKNDDYLNGVSTYDLVQINKHILGVQPLPNPYQLIAADANNSRSVTTFDIVELRKLILGIYPKLPNNSSWRFIPNDYSFPNPDNPFSNTFPEMVFIQDLQSSEQVEFTGLKVGDVNGNAVPNVQANTGDRAPCLLQIPDALLQPGETARVALSPAENLDLLGLQFALEFDPEALEINGLVLSEAVTRSHRLTETEFHAQPEPGLLTFSWDNPTAPQAPAREPLIFLEIKSKQAVQLSRALHFNANRLHAELYTSDGAIRPLQLDFLAAPNPSQTQIFPAAPNPGAGPVFIPLALAAETTIVLEIFDLNGRLISRQEQRLPAGLQRLEVPAAVLVGRSSVLPYRIRAGAVVESGRLVRI